MADIDIVRKERSSVWIWIVLAVVVLLALYFVFGRGPRAVTSGAVGVQPQTFASVGADSRMPAHAARIPA